MTNMQQEASVPTDPNGSIFLFRPLDERGYDREYLAMKLARGPYGEMESEEIEDQLRELKLRRALTERAVVATTPEI